MANTASNVSVGKPNTGGAIYVGATTATLPTDTTTELTGFTALGYISEDGLTNTNTPSSDKVKAWGGDTVLTYQTEKDDIFSFKLIEALNEEVLKIIYGSSNVTGSASTGYTIKANSEEAEKHSWIIDMVMTGGVAKRVVIPAAAITEIGDIIYSDSEAVGYEVTIEATPDASGNTHYEYIK